MIWWLNPNPYQSPLQSISIIKIIILEEINNHKLLTSDNTWIPISEFKINETKIKTSVTYPLMKIEDELTECNNWNLVLGILSLTTNNAKNYLQTLADVMNWKQFR